MGRENQLICTRRSDSSIYDCRRASEKGSERSKSKGTKIKSRAYRFARAVDSVISPKNQQKAVYYSQYGLLLNPVTALAGCDSFGPGIKERDGGQEDGRIKDIRSVDTTHCSIDNAPQLKGKMTISPDQTYPYSKGQKVYFACLLSEIVFCDGTNAKQDPARLNGILISPSGIKSSLIKNSHSIFTAYNLFESGKKQYTLEFWDSNFGNGAMKSKVSIIVDVRQSPDAGVPDATIPDSIKPDTNPYYCRKIEWTVVDSKTGPGESMAMDNLGNMYITVSDSSGVTWVNSFDSSGHLIGHKSTGMNIMMQSGGLSVDKSQNLIITGTIYNGPKLNLDILTAKFDKNLTLKWKDVFDGKQNQLNDYDQGFASAVDTSGNIYVTGYVNDDNSGYDAWVRKFDTNGKILWSNTLGLTSSNDFGYGIALDASGKKVYVVGEVSTSAQGSDILLGQLAASTGKTLLSTPVTYNNTTINGNDMANAVAVDGSGNAYVVGTETVSSNNKDNVLLKFDSSGKLVGKTALMSISGYGNNDEVNSVKLDSSGNIYVAGSVATLTTSFFVESLYPSLKLRWIDYDQSHRFGKAIVSDSKGNITVTGGGSQTSTSSPFLLRQYSQKNCP